MSNGYLFLIEYDIEDKEYVSNCIVVVIFQILFRVQQRVRFLMFIASTGPGAVVKAGSNPYLPFKCQRNKMFLTRSHVNMQY